MKDTLSNKLTSFNATLAVADKPEYTAIWTNQQPLAFTAGVALARADVTGLSSSGAEQSADITGSAAALKALRTQFETALHPLARAVFRCLTKQGNTEDAAKADITPSDLHNARATALAGIGETILDLADPLTQAPAPGQPAPGTDYGVTTASVDPVDNLWQRYSTAVGAPAGARAKRKALTGALPGKFAATEEKFAELDDLVLQFNTTDLGKQFIDAWFNARQVVALGRRAAKPAPAPAPATPTPK
jgi:hypothetical protein